jgi:hypothetical protein
MDNPWHQDRMQGTFEAQVEDKDIYDCVLHIPPHRAHQISYKVYDMQRRALFPLQTPPRFQDVRVGQSSVGDAEVRVSS